MRERARLAQDADLTFPFACAVAAQVAFKEAPAVPAAPPMPAFNAQTGTNMIPVAAGGPNRMLHGGAPGAMPGMPGMAGMPNIGNGAMRGMPGMPGMPQMGGMPQMAAGLSKRATQRRAGSVRVACAFVLVVHVVPEAAHSTLVRGVDVGLSVGRSVGRRFGRSTGGRSGHPLTVLGDQEHV